MSLQMKDIYIYEQVPGQENKMLAEVGSYENTAALAKVQTVINCHDELVAELELYKKWYGAEDRVEKLLARAKAAK